MPNSFLPRMVEDFSILIVHSLLRTHLCHSHVVPPLKGTKTKECKYGSNYLSASKP